MERSRNVDSQWTKYQVFEKEQADLPHRNAGSVHAPDAEMALENARDVFVRRPNCLSLWVVPDAAILSRTVEELGKEIGGGVENSRSARNDNMILDRNDNAMTARGDADSTEVYLVFQKQGQTARETFVVHVGQVEATNAEEAMARAREVFNSKNVFVWWVAPERAVFKSEESDAPSMFEPAHEKSYRNHLAYPVEPIMRELKSAKEMLDE